MKPYLLSLGAGLMIGVIYSLLNVRSPAPPIIALVGLMGILVGEQIIPVARHLLDGTGFSAAIHRSNSKDQVLGVPSKNAPKAPTETPL